MDELLTTSNVKESRIHCNLTYRKLLNRVNCALINFISEGPELI